jgi:ABC-type branched-subunit amino acid transport system ATPase component
MLITTGIHIAFGDHVVLDDVSFSLDPGGITCLLGGNGSGKTTLFNVISGFLRPDSGSVRLGGVDLTQCAPYRIAQLGIARTFQDLRLIGKFTVLENLLLANPRHPGERFTWALMPQYILQKRDTDDLRKANALISEYFLADVADRPASEISYGQQKLLTLACCAAMDAPLLLLDEPVAGISPQYRECIVNRLSSFRKAGKTILLIEHQTDFLEQTGDAFLYLQTGRLHRFDDLATLRSAPVIHEALN